MLKVDLHLHTDDDPTDLIRHTGKELVDRAAALGLSALAITLHDRQLRDEALADYARERGVVLIPGVERTIGGKHVATRRGGDFIGEIALLSTVKRTATVTATTQLRCFVLTRPDFRRVLDENPSVQRKVLEALGQRLVSYAESKEVS